jgi:hypothetical protein
VQEQDDKDALTVAGVVAGAVTVAEAVIVVIGLL